MRAQFPRSITRGERREPGGRAVEDPGLERPVRAGRDENAEAEHTQAEELFAVSPGEKQPAAKPRETRSREGAEQNQRRGGADAEQEHEEADLPEIFALTCERRGGSERRPDARAPHEAEQRAHQKLPGQTVECNAREQSMPRIAERAGPSRE